MNIDLYQALICVLVMTAVTFAIRALPFLVRLPPGLTARLQAGQDLFPALFMSLLVIYCLGPLFPLSRLTLEAEWPLLLSSLVVFVVHWFSGRLLLSMGGGVVLHLILMNLL